MKPSERIFELNKRHDSKDYEQFQKTILSIIDYLNEEYEKKEELPNSGTLTTFNLDQIKREAIKEFATKLVFLGNCLEKEDIKQLLKSYNITL